jgi:putative ABC transport system permease protein
MSGWRWLVRRLQVLFAKDSVEREMDEELRFHLDMEIRHLVESGLEPAEARRRALVSFGGIERHKEQVRDVRGARIADDLVQDARVALRSFVRQPGFVLTALATLGIGIGGSVAMFSVLDASLFRSLPYPQSSELVLGRVTRSGQVGWVVSGRDYLDYRVETQSFSGLAAITPFGLSRTVQGSGDAHRVRSMFVSPEVFSTLGVPPLLGRDFTASDGSAGAPLVAMLEHGYWERWHEADPGVVGKKVSVNGTPVTVVGVLPPGFRIVQDADVFIVFREDDQWATARQFHNFLLVGRLARGTALDDAQAEFDVISRRLEEAYPETNADKGVLLTPLRDALVEDYRGVLGMLFAAVGLVLLIACGNVAGLLLARGSTRRAEMSIRSALGAGQGRLARQLLTENALLALGAGIVGVALAMWLQRGIVGFVAMDRLGRVEPGLSSATLAFASLLCLGTVALFGALPAWRVARNSRAATLSSGLRSTAGRSSAAFRRVLVIGQVALTVVLLAGSGLLLRSFAALRSVDPGFDSERLMTAEVMIPRDTYPDAESTVRFFAEFSERLSEIPGVTDVALVSLLPIRDPGNNVRVAKPEAFASSGAIDAYQRVVWPGYFEAMGIRLVAGRDVARTDDQANAPVIVLSEQTARSVFGEEDPIGRLVGVDVGREEPEIREVVGVVGDLVTSSLESGVSGAMYYPFHQRPARAMRLAVRTAGETSAPAAAVRSALRDVDPGVPLSAVATMEEVISASVADRRSVTAVIGLFSFVAILLAVVGVYGVLAYQVARRQHEIGVRMALGASVGEVAGGVLRSGLRLAGIGLGLGIPTALAATSLIRSRLYGVGTVDLPTYAAVAVFVLAVSVVACLIPARRAARVDPVAAFRSE